MTNAAPVPCYNRHSSGVRNITASLSLQSAGARSISKALGGTSRGIGPAINFIGSLGSSRALSSINSGRVMGSMNTPEKQSMHRSIFYLPRNEEMLFESALLENKYRYEGRKVKGPAERS